MSERGWEWMESFLMALPAEKKLFPYTWELKLRYACWCWLGVCFLWLGAYALGLELTVALYADAFASNPLQRSLLWIWVIYGIAIGGLWYLAYTILDGCTIHDSTPREYSKKSFIPVLMTTLMLWVSLLPAGRAVMLLSGGLNQTVFYWFAFALTLCGLFSWWSRCLLKKTSLGWDTPLSID